MKKFGAGRAPQSFEVFKDHETDWAFKRTLEYSVEKCAEIGECLYAARRIDEKDYESWIREWSELALRVENQARDSLQYGNTISARESYLRASNYYRTAEYGCPPAHERFHELWQKSVDCFRKACKMFAPAIEVIEIPYDNMKLQGYFWRPENDDLSRPTLCSIGGNDSTIEEVFMGIGFAAVRRNYNFITFDYPGHRGAVHAYPNCVKSPEYEDFFKHAFDYLGQITGVDERIALSGYSFGGFVSSRVAIFEKRIKAFIPDSPIIDIPKAFLKGFLGYIIENTPEHLLDKVLDEKLQSVPLMKVLLEYSRWTWGFTSYSEEFKSEAFNSHVISDKISNISCPTLALVSEDEGEILVEQAKEFYNGISSKEKQLRILSLAKDGTNDHCQLDNASRLHQIVFDWLNIIFAHKS